MPQMQAGARQRRFRAQRDRQREAARRLQVAYDDKQNIGHRDLVYQRFVSVTRTEVIRVPVSVPLCMTYLRLFR